MVTGKLFPDYPRHSILKPQRGYLDDGEEYDLIQNTDGTLTARIASGLTYPFEGHLNTMTVELRTMNVLVGERVIPEGRAKLYIRGVPAYGFVFTNPMDALERMKRAIDFFQTWDVLVEWDDEHLKKELIDRPVWYREQPAVVKLYDGGNGKVVLVPDELHIPHFKPYPWYRGLYEAEKEVWEDILSPQINWSRGDE